MLFAFDILDMSTDSQCEIGSSPSPLFIITSPKTHLRSCLSDDTVDTGDRPARRLFGASSKKAAVIRQRSRVGEFTEAACEC